MVWESPIKNSFQVYQIVFGPNQIEEIKLVQGFNPYDSSKCLGMRTLEVTPNKQYILSGYCDQKMRMIDIGMYCVLLAVEV